MRFEQRIRLDGVSYRHDDAGGDRVLRGVDLEIAKGECVAIVGATGAGKTTLVDLVLGLLQPSEGHITVDGVPIADDLDGWRRQVGYVPQSPFLIDDTLRRNIAFGVPDHEIDDAAVQSVVRIAQLTSLVSAMPAGLDTLLGERGIRLSGGERQRVAIARALYQDPGVLILDEATSALDPGTELDLTRAIDLLKGRKTLIVVAHRPTTVERADRVIVLRDGRVDAIGSRDALIRSSAAFRQIAALSTDTTGAGRGDRTTG